MRPAFKVEFKNSGPVTAYNVVVNVTLIETTEPLPNELPFDRSDDTHIPPIPAGESAFKTKPRQQPFTAQDTTELNPPTDPIRHFYVVGFVEYTDELGTHFPSYEYCMVFNPDTTRAGQNEDPDWPFERCQSHNGDRLAPIADIPAIQPAPATRR
jgi:hypothetical protein